MLSTIHALHEAGKFEQSYAEMDRLLGSPGIDEKTKRDIGVFIVQKLVFHRFQQAFELLDPYIPTHKRDREAQVSHAFISYVRRDKEACVRSSARAIALKHDDTNAYRTLGLCYLENHDYLQAYTTFAAGVLFCQEKNQLTGWLSLAAAMLHEIESVSFTFDGLPFTFGLTCFNGMAVEASCHHVAHTLNEPNELRLIRSEAAGSRRIVECGCLVGNHTLFMAKAIRPKHIIVLDADPQSIAQTRRNIGLNPDIADISIDLRHRAIGAGSGEITLFGSPVQLTQIDAEAGDLPVDFLKIDVDGKEMDALNGLRKTIARSRPRIMIEISNEFSIQFANFLEEINYEIRHKLMRGADGNFFISPKEGWVPATTRSQDRIEPTALPFEPPSA